MKESVVIVDPDKSMSLLMGKILQARDIIKVKVFSEAESALVKISPKWNGILLTHFDTLVTQDMEFLAKVKQLDPELPVLIILDHGAIPLVVSAMRMGAYDVIQKSYSNKDILKIILGALEKRRLVLENRRRQSEIGTKEKPESFVAGRSRIMKRLNKIMRRAGKVDAEVLLVGERGTGKNLIARCLHEQSPRRHKNFIAVNCSSISEEALEIDLFGNEPGAFPRARHPQMGKFEYAEGGTIYLDKIDCLPVRLQDRLLHVLQEGTIARLGSHEPASIDIRVIASTKEDLKKACEGGWFREDLFYRLNVIEIALPPLKEHREDIPVLFQHFVLLACAAYQRPTPFITSEIFQELLARDWPGNVRELKNAAERFALGFDPDQICPDDREELISPNEQVNGHKKNLVEKMNAFEKSLIAQELTRTKGNVKETYLTLGLPRKTFYDKLNKHGLKRKDFLKPSKPSKTRSALH